MTLAEMKKLIARVEGYLRQGLVTPEEAESRITSLIDEAFPLDAIRSYSEETRGWCEEQRRLANRRKWKLLLDVTKVRAC